MYLTVLSCHTGCGKRQLALSRRPSAASSRGRRLGSGGWRRSCSEGGGPPGPCSAGVDTCSHPAGYGVLLFCDTPPDSWKTSGRALGQERCQNYHERVLRHPHHLCMACADRNTSDFAHNRSTTYWRSVHEKSNSPSTAPIYTFLRLCSVGVKSLANQEGALRHG